MRECSQCQGFVPPSLVECPHCEHHLGPVRGMTRRGKLLTGLMVSSTAMTLMACYGAPCGPDECGEVGSGTGGETEVCDENLTPDPITATQFPITVDASLLAQPGSNRGTCGGGGAEQTYEWTPPAAGSYRLSVEAVADTVLYVRDASGEGTCGDELGCNDDTNESNPELTLDLTTDPVVIVVDAFSMETSGDFTLTIEQL